MRNIFIMLMLISVIAGCASQISVHECLFYEPVYFEEGQIKELENHLQDIQMEALAKNNKNYEDICQ